MISDCSFEMDKLWHCSIQKTKSKRCHLEKSVVIGGRDKYHHQDIPYFHFKVDVSIVYYPNVPLMHPHESVDQYKLNDLIDSCTLWNWKYMKKEY